MKNLKERIALSIFNAELSKENIAVMGHSYQTLWNDCIEEAESVVDDPFEVKNVAETIRYSYTGSTNTYVVMLGNDEIYQSDSFRDIKLFIAELKARLISCQ